MMGSTIPLIYQWFQFLYQRVSSKQQEICKMGDEFRPGGCDQGCLGWNYFGYRGWCYCDLLLPIFIFAKQFPQMIEFFSIGDAGAGSCRLGR